MRCPETLSIHQLLAGTLSPQKTRDAMDHTAQTSPFYRSWVELVPRDLAAAEGALAAGDIAALGTIAEANALAMHASAFAAGSCALHGLAGTTNPPRIKPRTMTGWRVSRCRENRIITAQDIKVCCVG